MSKLTETLDWGKICLAYIKGDSDEAKVLKIKRSSTSILETQISLLKHKINKKENALEDAKERFEAAIVNNGEIIRSDADESYILSLYAARNAMEELEQEITDLEEDLAFLKDVFGVVRKEVVAKK